MNLSTNFTENESLHMKQFEAFNSNNILIEEYENFLKIIKTRALNLHFLQKKMMNITIKK